MAFAPPPSPNVQGFQIPAPQYTDPLETLARMQQMRTQNLQQQNAQLQLQQAQMKMESQKGVIRWLADMNRPGATQETPPAAPAQPSPAPAAGTPVTQPTPAIPAPSTAATPQPQPSSDSSFLGRMAGDASKYGILPDDWFAIQNHYLEYKQKSATLTEAQKKIDSDNADALAGAYRQLAQKKTSDQGDLNAVNNGLIARGVPREWLMTSYPVGHEDMTPQMQIQAQGNSRLKLAQMQEGEQKEAQIAQEKAGTEAETLKGTETARNLAASEIQEAIDPATGVPSHADYVAIQRRYPQVLLPPRPTAANLQAFLGSTVPVKERPEYDIKTARLNAMQAYIKEGPAGLDRQVDSIIDPSDQMNAKTKGLLHSALSRGDFDKMESIFKDAFDYQRAIATETNPAVIRARINQRVAEAQAVAPIEVNKAIQTEIAKAKLSPDVFNQIIDPTSRNRAIAETEKYTKEYITKMNDAQKMLDTINAAQGGNQAASGLIPLEEVRSIVNRVNRQELESVSGGGSLLRRVENMLSQATSGRMSAGQLKDLRALGELQKEGAKRGYQGSRLGTKTIYGVMPPEVDLTGIVTPAGGATGGAGQPPLIKTKAEYDALPSKTLYMESDGKTYRKP